jgi:hypothetical protein
MLLVQDDGVVAQVAVVGFRDQFGADFDLRGETNDASADLVFDQVGDGQVNVAGVGGVEGTEDEEDLSCSVGRGVEEACSGHLQRVFQTRLAARLLLS